MSDLSLETPFTELVGCRVPIQQAAMGGIGGPELAVAVASAGGLGMLHRFGPQPLHERLRWMASHTEGSWGIGFVVDDLEAVRDDLELAARSAPVVELFWGDPDSSVVETIHQGGGLAFWQVGSVEEALAAADAGCDAIVAQGVEAGGHVRGTLPLFAFLDVLLPRVTIPVVAAGGIASGRSMAAALVAGASAVRMGTRFVASQESYAHAAYRRALVAANADDTVYTTTFDVDWPDAPHRVLRSSVAAAESSEDDLVGKYDDGAHEIDVPRFSTMPPTRFSAGDLEAMAMYAGTGVGAIGKVLPAAEIVTGFAAETRDHIWTALLGSRSIDQSAYPL